MAIKYGIAAAAMRVSELAYQLETNAADDDAKVEVYTDKEILEEALYKRYHDLTRNAFRKYKST